MPVRNENTNLNAAPSAASPCASPSAADNRRWTTLCRLDSINIGLARYVEHNGRAFAVVRTGESTAVIFDDACPHAGASLSGGRVYDSCLVCPWHAWEFRVTDGVNPDNPTIAARMHPCRVTPNGEIQIGRVAE